MSASVCSLNEDLVSNRVEPVTCLEKWDITNALGNNVFLVFPGLYCSSPVPTKAQWARIYQ